jgi:hypothetical protein
VRFRRVLFVFLIAIVVVVLVRQGKQDPLVRIAGNLDSLISASRIKTQMEMLASNPHRAGTANNVKVGDAIIRRLQSAGGKSQRSNMKQIFRNQPKPPSGLLRRSKRNQIP